MQNRLSKSQLKPELLHYLRLVEKGTSFIVTDHGTPVARIIPYKDKPVKTSKIKLKGSIKKFINPTESVGLDDWDL